MGAGALFHFQWYQPPPCARLGAGPLAYLISVGSPNSPMIPAGHFTVEKAEAQRGEVIGPKPHGPEVVTLRFTAIPA